VRIGGIGLRSHAFKTCGIARAPRRDGTIRIFSRYRRAFFDIDRPLKLDGRLLNVVRVPRSPYSDLIGKLNARNRTKCVP